MSMRYKFWRKILPDFSRIISSETILLLRKVMLKSKLKQRKNYYIKCYIIKVEPSR